MMSSHARGLALDSTKAILRGLPVLKCRPCLSSGRTKYINLPLNMLWLRGCCLEIAEVVEEIEDRKKTGELSKKRVTCAHCGRTWLELVGLIVGHRKGSEDLCLRIGMESENCQTCRFRSLECPECGSKDVYEIVLAQEISEEVQLSFKGIRKVTRSLDAETS